MKAFQAHITDDAYLTFESVIREKVRSLKGPIYRTDAQNLSELYVLNIPESFRQHYNCRACKDFIDKYGGLATLNINGTIEPFLWDIKVPEIFRYCILGIYDKVARSKVTGVFFNSETVWGRPVTGEWTHLSGHPYYRFESKTQTAFQKEASLKQDFEMLCRGLEEYPVGLVRETIRVLELFQDNYKTLGHAKWLYNLHKYLGNSRGNERTNRIWMSALSAPEGFCHVKTCMINTIMDDIRMGKNFEEIKRGWEGKKHPLKYQRPTAPLKDVNIDKANELVVKLGVEKALKRRFAFFEEVPLYWKPALPGISTGFFDSLRSKIELPAQTKTWKVFERDVLPSSKKIEFLVENARNSYYGLVTAEDPSAPFLFQWDSHLSWFFVHNGSYGEDWNLPQDWVTVDGIFKGPAKDNEIMFIILNGCKLRHKTPGGGFFIQHLRSDLREIRTVLEKYSNETLVSGDGTANGYALQKCASFLRCTLRVNGADKYRIDRWE